MSVICAIFSTDGVCDDDVQTALQSLRAYPHDAEGSWVSGRMALAACTLHTTSESYEQSQPIVTDDGKVACVFDGYLTNHEELVRDLEPRGAVFRNRSDAEVAIKAYEAWGDDCAERLQGEFALIIADQRRGRLFATRDHLGFVPLYCLREDNRLIVASDFRTIAALKPNALEPNLRYLAQTLTNRWYLREETPWKQISRLKRAHCLSFDGRSLCEEKYWSPPTEVSIQYKSDAEYAEHYREVLFDCVRRSSRAHDRVGVAVSGGLDSSAIFSVADDLIKKDQWLAPEMQGYSLAAPDRSNAFELPYARAAAAHLGRELRELPLFDPDIDYYSEDGKWHCDIPSPSNAAMMLTMEQQVVSDGSRVMINGIGGDEWLQGHAHSYLEFLDDKDAAGFLRMLKTEAADQGLMPALKQCTRQTAVWLAPDGLREAIRKRMRAKRRRDDVALRWLAPELREALKDAEEEFEASLPSNPIEWSKVNLATTPRGDLTHSMMRRQRNRIGLESRHPMLYRSFIEFSLASPAHIKRRGAVTKVVHRQAMESYLPDKVLNRTTKANFTNTKIDHQFAEHVRERAPQALRELCDLEGLPKILDIDFLGLDGDYWAWEIWGLYASAAFLYQANCTGEINPATGVQLDRNNQ
ncbi:MAG: asparagine synthase-related protein [Erythrobacter sp.]|uniref:asparagine synthetase B family protein n=1 Tax=Erythrobacter sp. TaxID=1042 RepID=UPI003296D72E